MLIVHGDDYFRTAIPPKFGSDKLFLGVIVQEISPNLSSFINPSKIDIDPELVPVKVLISSFYSQDSISWL